MGDSTVATAGASDSETIAASLERPEGFAAIFDRHHRAVHRCVARRASRAQADDIASMTFVVAFERRRRFEAASTTALPWLLGIATNLLHERHRRERREQPCVHGGGTELSIPGHPSDGVLVGAAAPAER